MNRRRAIQKAVGLGVAAVALPVLAKASEAGIADPATCNSAPSCYPPHMPVPPPPDTRTPEQLIADQELEVTRDYVRHLTQEMGPWSRRYASHAWGGEFDRLLKAVRVQEIPHELRIINGQSCIIGLNGNVVRQVTQQLYLA